MLSSLSAGTLISVKDVGSLPSRLCTWKHGNATRGQPDRRNIGTKTPGQARPALQHNEEPLRTHVQPRGSWYVFSYSSLRCP